MFSGRIRKKYEAFANKIDQGIQNYVDGLEIDYKRRAELNDKIKQIFLYLVLVLFALIILGLVQERIITFRVVKYFYGRIAKITPSQWSDFSSNLFATLIGASVGIPIALVIDRIVQRRNRNDTKLILLYSLLDTLALNLNILTEVEKSIKDGKIQLFRFDLDTFDYTNLLRYELISDLDLVRSLEKVRYLTKRLQKVLDILTELPTSSMSAHYPKIAKEYMDDLVEKTIHAIQPTRDEIMKAISSVITEIQKSENYPFYNLARGLFLFLGINSGK